MCRRHQRPVRTFSLAYLNSCTWITLYNGVVARVDAEGYLMTLRDYFSLKNANATTGHFSKSKCLTLWRCEENTWERNYMMFETCFKIMQGSGCWRRKGSILLAQADLAGRYWRVVSSILSSLCSSDSVNILNFHNHSCHNASFFLWRQDLTV